MSGLGLFKYFGQPSAQIYPGRIVSASSTFGHRIRDGGFPPPEKTQEIETVIVGGGIAGLSAAWWLTKQQYDRFVLLELEPKTGGSSQSGTSGVSAYPWGAHYLPLPGPEAAWVFSLLEELGVIEGYDAQGKPLYNEYYLCADPHERLFIQGRFQEGILPQIGITEEDRRQYDEFFTMVESYKNKRGRDGKRAFVIPLEESSQDPEFLALDQMTMASFLTARGLTSTYLHWYVNYCCRDDYGMGHQHVSAWAGLHYFASRIGKGANADSKTVLTWPEGNGWLAERLFQRVARYVRPNAPVFSIRNHEEHVWVDYFDVQSQKSITLKAKKVIFAAPRFVAMKLLPELQAKNPAYVKPAYAGDLRYAPWMVANVTLSALPQGKGAPLSWDNVNFQSDSLGYVVATHQSLKRYPQKTVITYYLPLAKEDPAYARKMAAEKSHQEWAKQIAEDLATMHPSIRETIENIDVWLWGHGMITPKVGYLWGPGRQEMLLPLGHIHFAHSDMSGISIFEEAQYRGIKAAQNVLEELKHLPKGTKI